MYLLYGLPVDALGRCHTILNTCTCYMGAITITCRPGSFVPALLVFGVAHSSKVPYEKVIQYK